MVNFYSHEASILRVINMYMHDFTWKILECYLLIIFYHVEYYLIPSGRLVDHLPICTNG